MILKRKFIFGLLFITFILTTAYTDSEDRPFIGTTTTCGESYSIEPGSCYVNCTEHYYFFWIRVQSVSLNPQSC